MLLKELWAVVTETDKPKKKNKKDKSADKYLNYVAGNTILKNVCSGKLSGEKQEKS